MGKFNLDIFGDLAFQTLADGTRVFFPYGALTRGHVVVSEEIYQRLFFLQKWWSIGTLIVGVSMGIFEVPWQEQLPPLLILNVLQYYFTRRVTITLPVSSVRFAMNDLHKSFPKLPTLSPVAIWCLTFVGTISIIMGLTVVIHAPEIWPTGIIFIGIGVAIIFYCVRSAKSNAG